MSLKITIHVYTYFLDHYNIKTTNTLLFQLGVFSWGAYLEECCIAFQIELSLTPFIFIFVFTILAHSH